MPRRWIVETAEEVAELVASDARDLEAGGVKVTKGDLCCITFGHVIRLAIWYLRHDWDPGLPVDERLKLIHDHVTSRSGVWAVEQHLERMLVAVPPRQPVMREENVQFGAADDSISF